MPDTISKLQNLVQNEELNFQSIKFHAITDGKNFTKSKLTSLLFNAISSADSPTSALDSLLRKKETPTDWIHLIIDNRNLNINLKSRNTHL